VDVYDVAGGFPVTFGGTKVPWLNHWPCPWPAAGACRSLCEGMASKADFPSLLFDTDACRTRTPHPQGHGHKHQALPSPLPRDSSFI
jgi:hypothetical protein